MSGAQLATSKSWMHVRLARIWRMGWLVVWITLGLAGCDRATITREPVPCEVCKVVLGAQLFFDPALSIDGTVACATCHQPARAFTDGRALAVGRGGQHGTRNTPSLLDVGRQQSLFWDGRRARLEDQALDPLLNPIEHGLVDEAQLLARLRASPRLVAAFEAAYGRDEPSVAHAAEALAAFERTLTSSRSAFDRFRAGEVTALAPAARRGWQLFDQRAHCTRCHVVDADDEHPLLTDHEFHSLAVGFGAVARELPQLTRRLVGLHRGERPLSGDVLRDPAVAQLGRFVITLDPHDVAAFKTPGLRDVARTAPYMHDGSVATLGDAVELEVYARDPDGRPPILTPVERADVVAFLEALTGD